MQIVITIVTALLMLTGLIVAHEFGHYIVAKKNGIKVSEFAVGFGPKLIKWRKGETEFSVRIFFIGGFVRFADDVEKDPEPGDFRQAPLRARFWTILAGPVANVLVAIVLAAIFLIGTTDALPKITYVDPAMPAYEAGVREGDIVTSLNGVGIDFYNFDMQNAVTKDKGDSLPIIVERDGQEYRYDIPFDTDSEEKLIGIEYKEVVPRTYGFFEAIGLSFKWIFIQMGLILSALGQLFFMGQGIENMAGIVGTVAIVGEAVQVGANMVVMLAAMISVNLAIVNLLPIPALDGGKMVLYGVEAVRKKPASEKVEGILNLIGFVLIIGLAIFLVFQDVGRMMG